MLDNFFRNTLAAWQWGLLALVPLAIVALYFLKLKRIPLEVPSTYLWKKSIEDLHVNSLWQRIRQNLLMYLQLLAVLLAMLALLRPGWQGTKLAGDRFIFLVDNSASMQATDVDEADNRLELAKQRVRGLIDQMQSGMTAMIVSFADRPQVVQQFTDNRRLLRERLATIEPTYRTTDLKGALELADGLANPGKMMVEEDGLEADIAEAQPATLFIFSDGRFEDVKDFSLGNLDPIYAPIGSIEAENLAITAFNSRRGEGRAGQQQAFAQVTNFSLQPHDVIVELSLDGSFLDAQRVTVPAGGSAGVVFALADAPAGSLRAKLSYSLQGKGPADSLPIDDIAYGTLGDGGPGRVLIVSPGNPALEVTLATARAGKLGSIEPARPSYLKTDEYRRRAAGGEYDLVIFDQCAPEEMPQANTLFLGRFPPGETWQSVASEGDDAQKDLAPQIIDWNQSHPLLAHVELSNVLVAESLLLEIPPGGDTLIESTGGSLAAIGPRGSFQDVVFGFGILGINEEGQVVPQTDWPRRHSFPTFWLNVLSYLASGGQGVAGDALLPGAAIKLRTQGQADQVTVRGPDSRDTIVRRDTQSVMQFSETDLPGVYEVFQEANIVQRFAVNLFHPSESDVRVLPSQDPAAERTAASIRIGNIDVAAVVGSTPDRKEIWKVLLICVFVVLLIEWVIYNRRVYV